jgi:uncharacterized protein
MTQTYDNKAFRFRPKSLFFLYTLTFWLFLFSNVHADEPWGKDSELAKPCNQICVEPAKYCQTPLLGPFAEIMINFHQKVISPCDGPRSHFIPSSSQYTLDAMRTYGFYIGMTMGCDRLMRENKDKWVYQWRRDGAGKPIKYDPLP